MKLVIPPQFQMGCRAIKIRVNDELLKELDLKGKLVDNEDLVRLSRRSPLSMFETLIHEMLHEADYFSGDVITEAKIMALGGFMA